MPTYGFKINVEGNVNAKIKEINAALSSMGIKAEMETRKVSGHFAKMRDSIKEHFGGIKSMILGGLGLGAAFAGIELVKRSKEHFDAMQKSTADLRQTLVSMGGASRIGLDQMLEMAEGLNKTTIAEKSMILASEGMMATFGNIKGKQFVEGMQASADFASKFFQGDMVAASKSLGIALDDPIKGMARLHRTGVSFTEQQKEQIKNFQKAGELTKAQEIILKEIKRETGGQAKAQTETDAGKIAMAKKEWEEVEVKIGEIVSKIQIALIPVMKAVIGVVSGILDFFESTSTSASIFKDIILAIAAAFAVWGSVIGILALKTAIVTAAQWLWNAALAASPLTWIILGIVALIAVMMVLWDKFKVVREFLGGFWGAFVGGIKFVWHLLVDLGNILTDIINPSKWGNLGGDLKKGFSDLTSGFADAVKEGIVKGAEDAGNSKFKFADLLSFNTGQKGKEGTGTPQGRNAVKDAAINTSNLSGASGGLGQAKVINIRIDTMQKIEHLNGGKELAEKGQNAIEVMVRTLNNIAYSQSSSQ